MKEPEEHEIDCLERIAHEQSGVIPHCTGNVLLHLEPLGLIEKSPRIWLASQLIRSNYRLTPAGQAVLHKHRHRQGMASNGCFNHNTTTNDTAGTQER